MARKKNEPRKRLFPKGKTLRERIAPTKVGDMGPAYTQTGSVSELKRLKGLNDRVTDMQMDMTDFSSRGQSWLDKNEHQFKGEASGMNKMFQNRMMMMCVMPLAQGIDRGSLGQAVGMYIGMAAFSPDFRAGVIEKKGELMRKLSGGGDNYAYSSNPYWKKKVEKTLAKGNNGRVPFSQESAAVMEIGLGREAYNKMRQPGVNPEDVMTEYRKAQSTLYTLAEVDGISKTDIQQGVRSMVGKFAERERELGGPDNTLGVTLTEMQFQELGFDAVVQGDTHEVAQFYENPKTGKMEEHTIHVWDGDFVYYDTGESFDGSFNPRMPSDIDKYKEVNTKFITDHLETIEADTPEDILKTRNALIYGLQGAYADAEGIERPPIPDNIRDDKMHLSTAKYFSKYARMAIEDGHSQDDIIGMIDNSWTDAGTQYMKDHPDIAEAFYKQYYSPGGEANYNTGSAYEAGYSPSGDDSKTSSENNGRRMPKNLPEGYEDLDDNYTFEG